jgi:outer membrane protein OmpA-like peptidoglycan-associated protein
MRTSDFGDFDEALLESSKDRNWILVGLMISLAIHGALCGYFYRTNFMPTRNLLEERVQTAMFKVKNVDSQPLDKAASVDQTNPAAKPDPDKTDVQLPDEKKSFDQLLQDVHASAVLPDDTQDVLPDKPQVDPSANSVMKEIEATSAQTLSKSPNATREQNLMTDSATSGRPQPALTGTEMATSTTIKKPNTFTNKLPGDSAGPNTRRAPGFSDLDSLLAQKGPLGSGTQMRMPDDQLFSYDSSDLQPSAMSQLQKLGTLIKRNPKATFAIEGYADSLGSAEYNLDLSYRRADSVKAYLVEAMGINPAQITSRGYGASKFIVAPRPGPIPFNSPEEQVEIERQRPNRRVVIVVHTDAR